MIDMKEVDSEISMLENGKTTYSTLEKLSVLYAIKNQHSDNEEKPTARHSYKTAPASEFLEVVQNVPLDELFNVLNEHMDAVRIVYPKEYDAVIKKIREI